MSKKIIGRKKIDIIDIGSNMGVHTLNLFRIKSIELTKLIDNIKLSPHQLLTNKIKKQQKVYY